jgi:hypothetical protein
MDWTGSKKGQIPDSSEQCNKPWVAKNGGEFLQTVKQILASQQESILYIIIFMLTWG